MTTLTNEFDRAFRLHQQGKLREAFLRYDAILKADPKHAPALHYSGVVLHQAGNHWGAVERIRAAIAIDAASAEAWSNLAMALHAGGRQVRPDLPPEQVRETAGLIWSTAARPWRSCAGSSGCSGTATAPWPAC